MTVFLVWVHLLAAVAWIGGMLFLSLVIVPALKHEPLASHRGILFRAIALRFRTVVWTSVAVLLSTGPVLLRWRGDSLVAPGGWPLALQLKLVMVAALLGLSAGHDFLVGSRVGQVLRLPEPARTPVDRALVAWSPWLPRLSLVLALAILVAAVAFARL